MWGYFANKRLDLIEARVARLEKRGQFQLVGGADFETEFGHVKHELARMNIALTAFLGIPIPDDLPDDLLGMR